MHPDLHQYLQYPSSDTYHHLTSLYHVPSFDPIAYGRYRLAYISTVAYEIYLSRGTAEINPSSNMATPFEQDSDLDARNSRLWRQPGSHTCHPALIRRPQLGNTRGAVFLSCSDEPPRFDRPMTLQQPRRTPSIHRGYASEDGCADHGESSSRRELQTSWNSARVATSTDAISVAAPVQSTSPTLLKRLPDSRHTGIDSSDPCQQASQLIPAASEPHLRQITRSNSPTEAAELQIGQPHCLRRTSSFQAGPKKGSRKPLVRFASQELQGDAHLVTPARSPGTVTRLCPSGYQSNFTNPFASGSDEASRTNSSASDAASYLRLDAFAGHRDTLARIRHRTEEHSADTVRNASFSSLSSSAIDLGAFAGHRDTFARIHFEKRVSPYVPSRIIERLLSYLSSTEYLNLRLTCRQWCRALPPPRSSAIHRLPREIMQLIFSFQDPCDFDAARHTCREWFIASLDFNLLCVMLRTMQCQHA